MGAADPIGATYVGIAGHDDQLTDLSPDGFAARAELDRRTLAELDVDRAGPTSASGSPRRRCRSGSAWPSSGTTPATTTSEVNVIASALHDVRGSST